MFFLLLTPLGLFNDWIPPLYQTGYYSVTTIDAGDDSGYYAFLRSAFFDRDFDFINEINYAHSDRFMSTGYVFNNWQIGQSILFIPFFLIGHLVASLYNSLGYPVSLDGYSAPYYIFTAIASQTYIFAGLLLLFSILKQYFENRVALISVLVIWLSTPLIYYSFIRQRMAHSVEFFTSVIFIWYWLRSRNSKIMFEHALLGAILGLLCMIRSINICFLGLYLTDQIVLLRSNQNCPDSMIKTLSICIASFGIFLIVMLMPQIYTWYQINGVPFPVRHIQFAGQGIITTSFLPLLKKIFSFFLDMQWGLIFSAPVLIIGLIGVSKENGYYKSFRTGLCSYLVILFLIINLYPESSDAYGHRHLISATAVFALGLAAVLNKLYRIRFLWYIAVGFILFCVLAQYLMIAQYKVTLPYDDPRLTVKALTGIPEFIAHNYDELLRSTNLMRLLLLGRFSNWDYKDAMFLFFFPFFQMIFIVLVYYAFLFSEKILAKQKSIFKPKIIAGGILLVSITLVAIVNIMTPPKTNEEIMIRNEYLELIQKADVLEKAGKYNEALGLYHKVSTLMPGMWQPHFKIGSIWDKKKNIAEANRYYTLVLSVFPNNAATLFSLGNNLMFLGKFEKAEHYLKSAIRINPRDKNNYDVLAQIYVKTRRLDKAEKMFKAALVLDPFFSNSHINLAILYTLMNRPEKATPHLREGIQLGASGPTVSKLAEHYGHLLQ